MYECTRCNFKHSKKSSYETHLLTKKHIKNITLESIPEESIPEESIPEKNWEQRNKNIDFGYHYTKWRITMTYIMVDIRDHYVYTAN